MFGPRSLSGSVVNSEVATQGIHDRHTREFYQFGVFISVRYMYFNTCYNSSSMRVVPNDNDTTGFFCALITKVKELPSVISKLFTHSFL